MSRKTAKKDTIILTTDHTTLAQIRTELKSLGYTVTEMDDYEYQISHKKGTLDDNNITFIVDQLPCCCGVSEIGELTMDNTSFYMEDDEKKAALLLVRFAFLSMKIKTFTSKKVKRGCRVGRPIIFCSNGINACQFVEQAMEGWSQYKNMSISQNGNAGNIIKTYITT